MSKQVQIVDQESQFCLGRYLVVVFEIEATEIRGILTIWV